MLWQWIGLAVFSLTLLPIGLAMAAGRVPARLRARFVPVRVHGWAILAIYAVAPLNAIPRLAGASPELSLALTAAAGIAAVAGCLMLGLARLTAAENGAQ
ncbi:hypothetical protein AR457_38910 [Streptomyces agglomeratus]|uniref:hypothetical protein n=1 Tax=Streptomyces TaxID=1883 RepID=UPI0008526594|nr:MULTISPECIES: hypothetical protein [Streptomyces]OEJ21911.1 hypothetical protein AR457_38910 [Streptomyces agglomeratus]OEJ49577.1 hypothetical protein BGK72_00890 [Streptomyces agglomeratus]OEJ56796.1 hypothetical protein BGM19_00765 [Streptomyces agglomeratus]GGX43226.1 hypothetical protein GCM10010353_67940 [Streptomyces chryseus]